MKLVSLILESKESRSAEELIGMLKKEFGEYLERAELKSPYYPYSLPYISFWSVSEGEKAYKRVLKIASACGYSMHGEEVGYPDRRFSYTFEAIYPAPVELSGGVGFHITRAGGDENFADRLKSIETRGLETKTSRSHHPARTYIWYYDCSAKQALKKLKWQSEEIGVGSSEWKRRPGYEMAIYQVDMPGGETWYKDPRIPYLPAYYSYQAIPPSRLKRVF